MKHSLVHKMFRKIEERNMRACITSKIQVCSNSEFSLNRKYDPDLNSFLSGNPEWLMLSPEALHQLKTLFEARVAYALARGTASAGDSL